MSGALRFVKTPEELRAAIERRLEELTMLEGYVAEARGDDPAPWFTVDPFETAFRMSLAKRSAELARKRAAYELVLAHIDSVHCPEEDLDPDDDRLLEGAPVVRLTTEELDFYFTPLADLRKDVP